MSERGSQLLGTAGGQISELIRLLSARSEAVLTLRCRGREKLGDGTVAALALHTADNYLRIATFLRAGRGQHTHDGDYTAENVDVPAVLERLSAGRDALSLLADLTDEQLDTTPPNGMFRFCDGKRTLEQVVRSLLIHQGHQIDTMRAAIN